MHIPAFNPVVADAIITARALRRIADTRGALNAWHAEGAAIGVSAYALSLTEDNYDLDNPADLGEAIRSLLVDLRHLCDGAHISFDTKNRQAESAHADEVAAEKRQAKDLRRRYCACCHYDVNDDTGRWFQKCAVCAAN